MVAEGSVNDATCILKIFYLLCCVQFENSLFDLLCTINVAMMSGPFFKLNRIYYFNLMYWLIYYGAYLKIVCLLNVLVEH